MRAGNKSPPPNDSTAIEMRAAVRALAASAAAGTASAAGLVDFSSHKVMSDPHHTMISGPHHVGTRSASGRRQAPQPTGANGTGFRGVSKLRRPVSEHRSTGGLAGCNGPSGGSLQALAGKCVEIEAAGLEYRSRTR